MKGAVQQSPATAGIELANWYWKGVRQFAVERFGISLSRTSCLNYLHRLGFVLKRPKKRLVKANEAKREAFVVEYAALWEEVGRTGGKIFFTGEAHFPGRRGTAGQVGTQGRTGIGVVQQSAVWGEGQLLLGGVPGDRGGGVDGPGWEQQLWDLLRLP